METFLFILEIACAIAQANHIPHADWARNVYLFVAAASYLAELARSLLRGGS